jgi:two-component system cell cycle sensor histidine kinase PleC
MAGASAPRARPAHANSASSRAAGFGSAGARAVAVAALMAQMKHELCTPLNAVIGFSDLMRRELHGPLGDPRYQDYAQYISESGGRLLQSSELTLAVALALIELMSEPRGRRKMALGALVRQACGKLAAEVPAARLVVSLDECDDARIVGQRHAMRQALIEILREAMVNADAGSAIAIRPLARSVPGLRIEIVGGTSAGLGSASRGRRLHLQLARVLLELQGARLTCCCASADGWWADIEFPQSRRGSASAVSAKL